MRTRPWSTLLLSILLCAAVVPGAAGTGSFRAHESAPQDPGQQQDQYQYPPPEQGAFQNFSPDQLDNLLSPIALYPDPLLAQVLLAATFPDQVDEAARYLRGGGPPEEVDNQPWDVSVKAVAHYPTVLYMMDNRLDWTTSVGQAYVNQSTDVQESIQRLRQIAHNNGALESGPQIEVVQQGPYWSIWPANPQFIYVPAYDPVVVFGPRPFGAWFGGPFITFGIGFPIGAWCIYDFDWGHRGIFYHGWEGPLAPRWAVRARPYVRVNNIYVNEHYRNVVVNRGVLNRPVNVDNLNRYNAVHRDVRYTNVAVSNIQRRAESNVRPVNNQVLQRNINQNDARLNNFRGREAPPTYQPARPQAPAQPQRPQEVRPQPQPQRPQEVRPQPQPQRAPEVRPQYTPQRSAFNVDQRPFDPRQSSARGQASRQVMSRPPEPPRTFSAPRPSVAPHGGGGGRRP
jgi:hypothetical protein